MPKMFYCDCFSLIGIRFILSGAISFIYHPRMVKPICSGNLLSCRRILVSLSVILISFYRFQIKVSNWITDNGASEGLEALSTAFEFYK